MLFKQRFHAGLVDGSITLSFRTWSSRRVKVGGRYKLARLGLLGVDAVDEVRLRDIPPRDARAAGFTDREELATYLSQTAKRRVRADQKLYRVRLHFAGPDTDADPAQDSDLSSAQAEELVKRLARMDHTSQHGAWTEQTLHLIEKHPHTAAARLAQRVGRETLVFKVEVRKLKKLGLTESFDVGYSISPRGRAFLDMQRARR